MGVGGQYHTLTTLPLEERPDTNCVGGWMGPRAGQKSAENFTPHMRYLMHLKTVAIIDLLGQSWEILMMNIYIMYCRIGCLILLIINYSEQKRVHLVLDLCQ
jgi:hypothetical protein